MQLQSRPLGVLVLLISMLSHAALATGETTGEEKRFGFGLSVGYGDGVSVRSVQNGKDVGDVEWMAHA